MTARELCAPLELCKRIPEGEFGDSHFVYVRETGTPDILLRCRWAAERRASFLPVAPALTLEEVLREMDPCDLSIWRECGKFDVPTAAAALEAWLEAKGGA